MADDAEDSGSDLDMGPTYYTCLVCMAKAHLPLVSLCGHHFCQSCILKWLRIRPRCPYCQNFVDGTKLIPLRYGAVREDYQPLPREVETVQANAVLPAMGMFLDGFVEYPLEPRPRFRPLPPQLLRQVPQHPVRRVFLAPDLVHRGSTIIIMAILCFMYLNCYKDQHADPRF